MKVVSVFYENIPSVIRRINITDSLEWENFLRKVREALQLETIYSIHYSRSADLPEVKILDGLRNNGDYLVRGELNQQKKQEMEQKELMFELEEKKKQEAEEIKRRLREDPFYECEELPVSKRMQFLREKYALVDQFLREGEWDEEFSEQTLGMDLQAGMFHRNAFVVGWRMKEIAEDHPRVARGSQIVGVNRLVLKGIQFEYICRIIKLVPRPITIRFYKRPKIVKLPALDIVYYKGYSRRAKSDLACLAAVENRPGGVEELLKDGEEQRRIKEREAAKRRRAQEDDIYIEEDDASDPELLDLAELYLSNGRTPLMCAALEGHRDMVDWLVKRGASVNAADENGCGAFLLCLLRGKVEMAKYLAEKHSANTVRADWMGRPPLLACSAAGQVESVKFLIERGVDLDDADDRWGWTALHWAAHGGHCPVLSVLLAAGADMYAEDKEENSPYLVAVSVGHKDVVALLRATLQEAPTQRICFPWVDRELITLQLGEGRLSAWYDGTDPEEETGLLPEVDLYKAPSVPPLPTLAELWIGGKAAVEKDWVLKRNFRAIVSLTDMRRRSTGVTEALWIFQHNNKNPEKSLAMQTIAVRDANSSAAWFSVLKQIPKVTQFMHDHLQKGENVLVHDCTDHGAQVASVFVAAYLATKCGVCVHDALMTLTAGSDFCRIHSEWIKGLQGTVRAMFERNETQRKEMIRALKVTSLSGV